MTWTKNHKNTSINKLNLFTKENVNRNTSFEVGPQMKAQFVWSMWLQGNTEVASEMSCEVGPQMKTPWMWSMWL